MSDGALTFCIVELRKALGDNAKAPRFIETVARRGYRFIAEVVSGQLSVVSSGELSGVRSPASEVLNRSPTPNTQYPSSSVVNPTSRNSTVGSPKP